MKSYVVKISIRESKRPEFDVWGFTKNVELSFLDGKWKAIAKDDGAMAYHDDHIMAAILSCSPEAVFKDGTDCKHIWKFQHVVYWMDSSYIPGSGARSRHYADRFFCEKCLEQKDINERIVGNSYTPVLEGAFPR